MNSLDINHISILAPYKVLKDEGEYLFETDHGILYAVEFKEEPMFGSLTAYWFNLVNRSQKASPNDVKIRATVTCIIEEFFRANPDSCSISATMPTTSRLCAHASSCVGSTAMHSRRTTTSARRW